MGIFGFLKEDSGFKGRFGLLWGKIRAFVGNIRVFKGRFRFLKEDSGFGGEDSEFSESL